MYANIYSHIPHIYIYQLHNVIFYYFTEIFLNIDEEVLRDHWIPVAFMPIYDPDKSKRLIQGYECDSARAMRLYQDCWRHILGTWKDKTQNSRPASLGNAVGPRFGRFLADCWVINRCILCINLEFCTFCIF